jgi:transcriptional regulator with XRE-family HTH domain
METVGQRIRGLRKVTKTSQKELGKFCGVSDVAVGYWEKILTFLAKLWEACEVFQYIN